MGLNKREGGKTKILKKGEAGSSCLFLKKGAGTPLRTIGSKFPPIRW